MYILQDMSKEVVSRNSSVNLSLLERMSYEVPVLPTSTPIPFELMPLLTFAKKESPVNQLHQQRGLGLMVEVLDLVITYQFGILKMTHSR